MELANKKFKTTNIKGKSYVEVKERLLYLANDFNGDYSINTEYTYYPERKMWVVKATLTLMQNGTSVSYTGLAQEIESDDLKKVNSTSALENAETSAVGRACAMAGIGILDAIASADEVVKAQNRTAAPPSPVEDKPKFERASHKQKEEIIELVNNKVITSEEKNRMLQGIEKLSRQRAAESIEKLKKTIAERKNVPA